MTNDQDDQLAAYSNPDAAMYNTRPVHMATWSDISVAIAPVGDQASAIKQSDDANPIVDWEVLSRTRLTSTVYP